MKPDFRSPLRAAIAALVMAGSAIIFAGAAAAQTPGAALSRPPAAAVAARPPGAGVVAQTPGAVTLEPAAPAELVSLRAPALSWSPFPAAVRSYPSPLTDAGAPAPRGILPGPEAGDKDDPAYSMYREAYELILREKWEEARSRFRALAKKYPDSEYRDDAEYWIAYSWRETDSRKAIEAYKNFLKEYRQSKYFDDALADMDLLMARSMAVVMPPVSGRTVGTPVPVDLFTGDSGLTVTALTIPSIAPMMKFRRLERMLWTNRPGLHPGWTYGGDDDTVDDATRLRLESVYAIGMAGEDEKGFTAMRRIAVDPKEKKVLRVAAIEELSKYRSHDILPVYIEIAKNDTSEEMQLFAIDYIGNSAHDKEKAFDALMTLYRSLPAGKSEKRKMVFYSIAETGGDRAIDFLSGIARSDDDIELRREAVYYLGTIGGEKARAVLYDIVNGK